MDSTSLVATAAVGVAVVIYWFIWVMGSAEVKGKQAVNLQAGSIARDTVHNKYKEYWSFFRRPNNAVESSKNTPDIINTYYNLVTDIFEWGWGQSFHFSPSIPNRSHRDATRIHEELVADLLQARHGQRILDVGCGVGGPMRTIAARSGSTIVGITINEYQVGRARMHNSRAGLAGVCEVVCGNFLQMPFEDCSFDGAYSIEATCHAPNLEDVYAEICRVLKPGGLFVSYEWGTTELYRTDDPKHVETIQGILQGGAIPRVPPEDQIAGVARKAGFEVLEERNLALPPSGPWWTRLKTGRLAYWRNYLLVSAMTLLRIAPKGVAEVHEMLCEAANHLAVAGEMGIFTPMYMILCRKPLTG